MPEVMVAVSGKVAKGAGIACRETLARSRVSGSADTEVRRATRNHHPDAWLVASLLVLYTGRAALARFAEEPPALATSIFGDLGPPLFAAIALSVVLAALAVRWSSPLRGAVRALVAAVAYMALAVYPTEGFHGNAWYALPGTVFAFVALVRNMRVRRSRAHDPDVATAQSVAAGATSIAAGVLLGSVALAIVIVILIFWSLGDAS
jgi:hypothetical protein